MGMNPTKKRMLDAGRALLLNKGVEATAVEDVLKATKTGKSQFYHFFGNKAGMVREIIEEVTADFAMDYPPIHDWNGVQNFLNALAAGISANGHPAALLAMTIRPEDRANHPELLAYYQTLRAPLVTFLQREQAEGRFVAAMSVVEMADLALTSLVGASILASIHTPSVVLAARTAHHMYLYLKAYARA